MTKRFAYGKRVGIAFAMFYVLPVIETRIWISWNCINLRNDRLFKPIMTYKIVEKTIDLGRKQYTAYLHIYTWGEKRKLRQGKSQMMYPEEKTGTSIIVLAIK